MKKEKSPLTVTSKVKSHEITAKYGNGLITAELHLKEGEPKRLYFTDLGTYDQISPEDLLILSKILSLIAIKAKSL